MPDRDSLLHQSERQSEAPWSRHKGVTVSAPSRRTQRSKPQIAISTDIDQYVQLDADQLRWLIEEAGPKALRLLEGS